MRLFLFIVFLYLLFRLFRTGKKPSPRPNFGSNPFAKARAQHQAHAQSQAKNRQAQPALIDEMKKCPTCGTFNPTSIALRSGSEFYCDNKCLK